MMCGTTMWKQASTACLCRDAMRRAAAAHSRAAPHRRRCGRRGRSHRAGCGRSVPRRRACHSRTAPAPHRPWCGPARRPGSARAPGAAPATRCRRGNGRCRARSTPRSPAQAEPGKARIAEIARVLRRHRVGAEPEEAERAALEDVRDLLAAAAELDEIVAIAGALEQRELFLTGAAGQRIAFGGVEREILRLARLRDRKFRDENREAAWRCSAGAPPRRRSCAAHRPRPARRGRTSRGRRTGRATARARDKDRARTRSRSA